MTSYTSVATDPSTSAMAIRRVYLTGASPRHVLLVVLLSTGHVEHRLVEIETAPSDSVLTLLSNYLNSLVADHDLTEMGRATRLKELSPELKTHLAPLKRIMQALQQVAVTLSEIFGETSSSRERGRPR